MCAPVPEMLSLLFVSSSNSKNMFFAIFSHNVQLFSLHELISICNCIFICALTVSILCLREGRECLFVTLVSSVPCLMFRL